MTDEYFVAVKNFNLSWDEVVQLGRNSLEYSFVQPDQKQRLLDAYNQAIKEFEQKYNGDWKALVAAVNATGSPYAEREFGIRLAW
jgi:adenosine deaminase CECR1